MKPLSRHSAHGSKSKFNHNAGRTQSLNMKSQMRGGWRL